MKSIGVGDGWTSHIGYPGEPVARVGIGEVVHHPVTAVQLALPLEGLDIARLVILGHRFVEPV
ncbi:hypothetical protein SDC9_107552 [bioreactor metagenome]|uniref:Uncharacterized protein n=1 Tax=bioreactor metagenome TaxID=1076179 RepID=A0A645B5I4_9ZZZZ